MGATEVRQSEASGKFMAQLSQLLNGAYLSSHQMGSANYDAVIQPIYKR
jgi:hypothetical protein